MPTRPVPGTHGQKVLAACPQERAAGRGTAPDTRRPSIRWKANPPGTASHHHRCTQPPTGHASRKDRARPPRPDTRAHSKWAADPTACPEDGQLGKVEHLTSDAAQNGTRQPPLGTFSRHPHSAQRRVARAHAVEPVLGPPCPGHTGNNPWPHARKDEWSEVGKRPTPDAPHPSKRRSPRALSCRPHSAQSQLARARAVGSVTGPHARTHPAGGRAAPSQVGGNRTGPPAPQASQTEHGTEAGHAEGHGPRGTALPAPSTGSARGARATPTRGGGGGADAARARAHTHTKDGREKPEGQRARACRTHRLHGIAYQRAGPPHTAQEARALAARSQRRAAGRGTAPDTRPPSLRWKANPPGTASHHFRGTQPLAGHASQRDGAGHPRPHSRAHNTRVADPGCPP